MYICVPCKYTIHASVYVSIQDMLRIHTYVCMYVHIIFSLQALSPSPQMIGQFAKVLKLAKVQEVYARAHVAVALSSLSSPLSLVVPLLSLVPGCPSLPSLVPGCSSPLSLVLSSCPRLPQVVIALGLTTSADSELQYHGNRMHPHTHTYTHISTCARAHTYTL